MKKIIGIVAALVVVAGLVVGGVVFVPKLCHTCYDCEEFFVGTGYEPNIISDMLTKEDQILCRACAEKHHVVSIKLGKSVEDFKRPLFEDKAE